MKAAAVGAFIGAFVSLLATGAVPLSFATAGAGSTVHHTGELITSTALTSDNRQLVTILDPRTRVMASYIVDGTSGNIALKSVRNIHWDLQLNEFNGSNPLPREIQSLIEQHVR